MSRLTIYERLKPEIKEALHSSENDKYKASIDSIVEALSSTTFYSDLKISYVSSLYTFYTAGALALVGLLDDMSCLQYMLLREERTNHQA